jgi:hypothetical protein
VNSSKVKHVDVLAFSVDVLANTTFESLYERLGLASTSDSTADMLCNMMEYTVQDRELRELDDHAFSGSAQGFSVLQLPTTLSNKRSCLLQPHAPNKNLRFTKVSGNIAITADPAKLSTKVVNLPPKVLAYIEQVWLLYLELGAAGSHWDPIRASSQRGLVQLKSVLVEEWAEFQNLGTPWATAQAWKALCSESGTNWTSPDTISVKLYLKQVAQNVPTTSRTSLSYLKWLKDNIGLPFGLSAVRIKKAGQIADSHVAEPIPPMLPRLWVLWDRLLMAPDLSPFELIIALAWDLLATSVLRPKHLFMSTITVLENRIVGLCCKGKYRVAGRRLASFWSCPKVGIAGTNIGGRVPRVIDLISNQGLSFDSILPNVASFAVSLSKVSSLGAGTMTRSKLLKFSSDLCATRGLPTNLLDRVKGVVRMQAHSTHAYIYWPMPSHRETRRRKDGMTPPQPPGCLCRTGTRLLALTHTLR